MRWLLTGLVVLVVAAVAAAAGIAWLVGTEAGLHWAAAQVPALRVEGLRGRLAGEIHADRLTYEADALRIEVESLALRAHLAALLGGRLTLDPLRATRIAVVLPDQERKEEKTKLPVKLHLAHARVDR